MQLRPAVRERLMLQGFACDIDPAVGKAAAWLRFTPAVSTMWLITAVALRSAPALWIFAALAAAGAAGWHPFDQIFNRVIRHALGAPPLPSNPAPRRFAMALASAWSAAAGVLLAAGFTTAGVLAGGLLALAGAIVATTHFCLGSWLWRQLVRVRRPPVAT